MFGWLFGLPTSTTAGTVKHPKPNTIRAAAVVDVSVCGAKSQCTEPSSRVSVLLSGMLNGVRFTDWVVWVKVVNPENVLTCRTARAMTPQIGRASWRERVCQYV